MKLEFANGAETDINNEEKLKKELESLGPDNDFAILTEGDSFIQTSYSGNGFLFQYSEAGSMYESTETGASLKEVMQIFTEYLSGDNSWKDQLHWEKTGNGSTVPGKPDTGNSFQLGRNSSGSLRDELINTAKRSVVNWIKRKIR